MIQWFPGHMAKARREVEENLKLVDIIIELVDARAPQSSENPLLREIIQNKPKLTLLMKRDLADDTETEKWLKKLTTKRVHVLSIDVNSLRDINNVIEAVKQIGSVQQEKLRQKGIHNRPIRAMIVGIPNVGKSTLINRLANRKIARIGARPGVTRKQQWIKVRNEFELLDTPGILWPKFEEEIVGKRLAAIGTIKDDLLPLQDIAAFILQLLLEHYPGEIEARYRVEEDEDMWELFTNIGKKRGALEGGGRVNFDKVAEIVIQDFREGRLGKVTLEFTR